MGKAFPNEKVFLLDEEDKLITEKNKNGELCVTGSALALGYYKNREQTAVQKNANQKQSTGMYCLKNAISKQDEIAMASEMCVFVYDAYTLAVCGCADAELVQVTEGLLYE